MFVLDLKDFIDSGSVSTQYIEKIRAIDTEPHQEQTMRSPAIPIVFLVIVLNLLWTACPVRAEQMYINDTIKITLRSGPGTDHKILEMVNTGDPVKRIRAEKDWSLVKMGNGTEGWVLNRFLSPELPKGIRLQILEKKYAALESFSKNPIEENIRLKEENQVLSEKVSALETQLDKLTADHENLKTGAADYLNLKDVHKRTVARLSAQTEAFENMEEELSEIHKRQVFRWLLVGAGILLLGFIIGMGARKNHRRYSL